MINGCVSVIVDLLEDGIFPFEFGDPLGFEAVFNDLLIDAVEARDVVTRAFFGVFDARVCRDNEGPVGGLREEQLAGGLIEGAFEETVGVGESAGEFDHVFFGAMEVRVDPVVSVVEPDFEEAVCAPA